MVEIYARHREALPLPIGSKASRCQIPHEHRLANAAYTQQVEGPRAVVRCVPHQLFECTLEVGAVVVILEITTVLRVAIAAIDAPAGATRGRCERLVEHISDSR